MDSMLCVCHVMCEYRTNPLGIDIPAPRLSWKLSCTRRGVRQCDYRIVTASSESDVLDERNLLWDSGRVESEQSVHVPYAGPALMSAQRVYWRVAVWDEEGNPAVSAPAFWEMGLLDADAWRAQWIGARFAGGPRTSSPAPYLRREFSLSKPLTRARLYATALGLYECYLNGARVGHALLTPGWTDYSKHIQYQTYDVTELVCDGTNALGAILGDGWAVGHVAWVGRQRYADRPQFFAQLVLDFQDGSTEIIATDEKWKSSAGPILESDLIMGESYDARRELIGWTRSGYDDARWCRVLVVPGNGAALVATNGPTVRRQEELRPVSVTERREYTQSRWIFDMGQNMVGWVRLRIKGKAGTTIVLKFAEALNPNGTLYTANLRTARCMDFYTLRGDGEEIWEPRFSFHGFRYVELSGYPGTVTPEMLTGIVIHSDMPATGTFECSDTSINQLQHNIVWSQKGNFVDVPTDCPQRDERLGWTGDAQVFVRTAAFNFNVAGFFTRWTRDLQDAQFPSGAYPAVSPNPAAWPSDDGGPAWADAGIICPWTIYLCYGDTKILADNYASMQKFVEFLIATGTDGLRCYDDYRGFRGFGDWLALDGSGVREGATSRELIGTAFFAYSTGLMARIAALLGHAPDAARYAAAAENARAAFRNHFVQADGKLTNDTQTAYLLALHFDLLPASARAAAVNALVADIQARDNHLSTGFVGTPYLNWVLSENGRADVAFALLRQTTWPSWLYSVTQGATTIWERWDAWTHDKGFQDPNMNSFNHYAYGAIGAWLYAVVGGIDLDEAEPGYKHIIMRPQPGDALSHATAELDSMYGSIRSAWKTENGLFEWFITIPPNALATIHLPCVVDAVVREGDVPAHESEGVIFLGRASNANVYRVKAGDYRFTARW